MKVAVVVALLVSFDAARPQSERKQQAADDKTHLWGLEDYHEGAEDRKRRAAEEEGAAGDHLFHGSHLWGLEDYHEGAEDRKRRADEEEEGHEDYLGNTEEREKRTINDDADDMGWVSLQNSDGNTYSQYNILE